MAKKKEEFNLEDAIQSIQKQYGEGAVVQLSQDALPDIDSIPTGSLALDIALGIGGVPKGRIVELYGPESSGKSTMCAHIIANAQKAGGKAAFIDVEHALDPKYLEKIGVDMDSLYLCQPNSGEEALNICETFAKTGELDVIVVDSVAALVPQAEIDGEMGDSHIGLQARLMSQAMRKLTPIVAESDCVCLFTNQIREKVGVMWGSPETTSGGRALKFYASIRMDIRRIGQLKDASGRVYGNRTKVKVIKNKVAPPFTEAEFDIIYGEGISYEGNVIDIALEQKVIEKKGSWFKYNGEMLGQGKETTRLKLRQKPELCEEIVSKLKG